MPNAAGNAVKRPTIRKISQTWWPPHTGPIASAPARRCSRARGPLASKSHTPPPKSAPASTAYAVSASQRMPATSCASLMRGRGSSSPGAKGGARSSRPGRCRWRRTQGMSAEGWRGGRRLRGTQDPVDDPRLASELGYEPARLHRRDRGRPADSDQPEQGAPRWNAPAAVDAEKPEQRRGEPDQHAEANHRVEREVDEDRVRTVVRRKGVQPAHLGVGIEGCEQTQQFRYLDRTHNPLLGIDRNAAQMNGSPPHRVVDAFHRCELRGLRLIYEARTVVTRDAG